MRQLGGILVAVLCAAAVHAGEVYKWVDKDGKVHYGDRPKHEAERVEAAPGTAGGGDAAGAADEPATPEQARAADCSRRKAQLATYKRAASIKETDSLGRTREYTEAERQQLLSLTEKQVAEACGEEAAAAP